MLAFFTLRLSIRFFPTVGLDRRTESTSIAVSVSNCLRVSNSELFLLVSAGAAAFSSIVHC